MMFVTDYYLTESRVGSSITPEEISGLHHTFFTVSEGSALYDSVNNYLMKHRIKFKYKRSVRDVQEALASVTAKDGVSILPEPYVEEARRNADVEGFFLKPPLLRPISILYRESGFKSALIDAFIEILMANRTRPLSAPVLDSDKEAHPPTQSN